MKLRKKNGPFRLIKYPANYDAVDKILGVETLKPMTIGVCNEHAFLITDIKKASKLYICGDCHQQLTKVSNLHRHKKVCSNGETRILCYNEMVKEPQTAWERAFVPRCEYSKGSIRWLEFQSQQIGCHIHHAICRHGGERYIAEDPVDGYEPISQTVFQYHGCWWHGCPSHCNHKDQAKRYKLTIDREAQIKAEGYKLVVMWECEWQN